MSDQIVKSQPWIDQFPHRVRVRDELAALNEKRAALDVFRESAAHAQIPKHEQDLLLSQAAAMRFYAESLTRRLDYWEAVFSAGKQVTQLGLAFDERMRFVLDDVRKFKLLDIATEQLDKGDRESAAAELDARFVLMAGEVGRLLDAIETTFSVNRPESL